MSNSQRFWRGLFFVSLIAALCGGLALPLAEAPAHAAPVMQVACSDLNFVTWRFDGDATTPTILNPTTGSGSFRWAPDLPINPNFVPGASGAASDWAVSFDNWTTSGTLDTAYYIELAVPTSGRNLTDLSFQYLTDMGPQILELHYSTNGSSFSPLGTPVTLTPGSPFNSLSFSFSSVPELDNNPNALFRIYGYAATNTAGTLALDNILFTGNCRVAPLTVIINEVAWAGTAAGSSDEWIELYNPSSAPVNLQDWVLRLGGDDILLNGNSIPAGGYFLLARDVAPNNTFSDVTPNLIYDNAFGLNNNGEILTLLGPNGETVDTANVDGGSWPEGIDSTRASMERRGVSADSDAAWATYEGIIPVAHDRAGSPILGTPGQPNWITIVAPTTVTITTTPSPSLVNQNVIVNVTVTGGSSPATGSVNVTSTGGGTLTGCGPITLDAAGVGSCTIIYTSTGTKRIDAEYSGDHLHLRSTGTANHTVGTIPTPTRTPTLTRTPTRTRTPVKTPTKFRTATLPPPPPPPLIAINEFVPRPGHDWNLDGVVNTDDEYIELLNHGVIDVNLSGYSLDDEANIGSNPFRLPSIVMKPGDRRVFFGSETGLHLSDGGDGVRLLKPNGQLGDAYNYFVVRFPDQSYCRLPDNGGLDDWNQNCFPTPGLQNSQSASSVNPPTSGGAETLCPIADTLPEDFIFAECVPFGANIWNPAYWDRFGWFGERYLPESSGKWRVFVD